MKKDQFNFLKEGNEKIGTIICQLWTETHKNCHGCQSEKACREYLERVSKYTAAVLIERGDMTMEEAERLEEI
jgi:hypothetical protein